MIVNTAKQVTIFKYQTSSLHQLCKIVEGMSPAALHWYTTSSHFIELTLIVKFDRESVSAENSQCLTSVNMYDNFIAVDTVVCLFVSVHLSIHLSLSQGFNSGNSIKVTFTSGIDIFKRPWITYNHLLTYIIA